MKKDKNTNKEKVYIKHNPQEDDLIFIESYTGPQEEACLMETKFDLEKFKKYQKEQQKKD